MNRLELLGTKTKTTKATTTARNAKKTPKAQTVKPTTKNATMAKREKKGIETRQDNANAYQEDQPDRSRDRRTWQIEGRDELQSDGRGDAGRGSLVDTQGGNARRDTLRFDPAGDQRQGQRRPIPQDRARPLYAGRPQVERLPPIATTTHTRPHVAVLCRLWKLASPAGLRHLRSLLRRATFVPTTTSSARAESV